MLSTLDHVPIVEEQAIIINYNTRVVSTLALLSSLRYINMPLLMIDCQSSDGSLAYFQKLQHQFDFQLLSTPLLSHGLTLNRIFTQLQAQKILLIDSDIEVLHADIITTMRQQIEGESVFGSGYTHGGGWMHEHKQPYGYYVERCWIPFVLLKTQAVKAALAAGQSFESETVLNEFPSSRFLSKMLIKRFRIPFLHRFRLSLLDCVRKEYFGLKPAFITYDTGAKLYQYLLREQKLVFKTLPWEDQERLLVHFHGVTRLVLNTKDHHGSSYDSITPKVRERLIQEYGLDPM